MFMVLLILRVGKLLFKRDAKEDSNLRQSGLMRTFVGCNWGCLSSAAIWSLCVKRLRACLPCNLEEVEGSSSAEKELPTNRVVFGYPTLTTSCGRRGHGRLFAISFGSFLSEISLSRRNSNSVGGEDLGSIISIFLVIKNRHYPQEQPKTWDK